GAAAFLQRQQGGPSAQATQTTPGGATATTPPLGVSACSAPSQVLQVSDDATCIPAPPAAVLASVLNSPAPLCDTSGITWTQLNDTEHTCNGTTAVTLTATSPNSLACAETFNLSSADGYASIYVTKGTGDPVLAFRQGQVAGGGGNTKVTGYYFRVLPGTNR